MLQAKNPITDRWVKIDTQIGSIVAHKKSPGPYKGIDIVGRPMKISFLSKGGKVKLRRRWGEKPRGEKISFLSKKPIARSLE